ncbi:hypothetical protein PENTCL1PPCAC_7391, partial [Pristionchus entomophagus]
PLSLSLLPSFAHLSLFPLGRMLVYAFLIPHFLIAGALVMFCGGGDKKPAGGAAAAGGAATEGGDKPAA